ncbi:hypothetical protein ACFSUK_36200, partial [Sphingobium scionense]
DDADLQLAGKGRKGADLFATGAARIRRRRASAALRTICRLPIDGSVWALCWIRFMQINAHIE